MRRAKGLFFPPFYDFPQADVHVFQLKLSSLKLVLQCQQCWSSVADRYAQSSKLLKKSDGNIHQQQQKLEFFHTMRGSLSFYYPNITMRVKHFPSLPIICSWQSCFWSFLSCQHTRQHPGCQLRYCYRTWCINLLRMSRVIEYFWIPFLCYPKPIQKKNH